MRSAARVVGLFLFLQVLGKPARRNTWKGDALSKFLDQCKTNTSLPTHIDRLRDISWRSGKDSMVLFFTSTAVDPPATIYMGRDKVENEDLIKYGDDDDVWFHVDKLSSAHVYLRLSPGMTWESIPTALLDDLSQLVKANSIEGNKKDNQQIIYTPWSNIKKTGDLAVGTVTFHNDHKVRRHFVKSRENFIVNRLNKTKKEIQVDHEAVRIERQKERSRQKREIANDLKNKELAESRRRKEEKEAWDYSNLYSSEAIEAAKKEKERMARVRAQERKEQGLESEEEEEAASDDSFM